jgi:hypothetical protein
MRDPLFKGRPGVILIPLPPRRIRPFAGGVAPSDDLRFREGVIFVMVDPVVDGFLNPRGGWFHSRRQFQADGNLHSQGVTAGITAAEFFRHLLSRYFVIG